MNTKIIKLFLRLALATSFLSAVADRFGLWGKDNSVWGDWDNFLAYTTVINPWFPDATMPIVAIIVTVVEIGFALCLLIGFKTERVAQLSGVLLLVFALAMTFSTGVKGALDYSVFSASAGAFALCLLKVKYLELDKLISKAD